MRMERAGGGPMTSCYHGNMGEDRSQKGDWYKNLTEDKTQMHVDYKT